MRLDSYDTAKLYLGEDMSAPEVHEIAGGEVVVFTTRCPGKSSSNEDAAAIVPVNPDAAVLIVADGVGGSDLGLEASNLTVRIIHRAVREACDNGLKLRSALLNGIEQAGERVHRVGRGAATTLAVVEIQDGRIRPYHVGDASVLLTGRRGKVKLQTVPHSPVGFAVEAGLLSDAEAIEHEDLHLVSNVVGADDMRIEVGPRRKLAKCDTVLLASDGLFDNLPGEEIVDLVRKGSLSSAADRLRQRVDENMVGERPDQPSKPDDFTFVLYRRKRVPNVSTIPPLAIS